MIYGYARYSTNESKQDINRQIKELKATGANEVIIPLDGATMKVVISIHSPRVGETRMMKSSMYRT